MLDPDECVFIKIAPRITVCGAERVGGITTFALKNVNIHLHEFQPTCIFCAGDWVGLDVSRAAQRIQQRGRGSLQVGGLRPASGVREAFLEVMLKVTSLTLTLTFACLRT